MGLQFDHHIINGRPVLYEVFHESKEAITSIIITDHKGNKPESVRFSKSEFNKELYQKTLGYGSDLKAKNIIAAVPIDRGGMLIQTTLYKYEDYINILLFNFYHISRSRVTGGTYGYNLKNYTSGLDGLSQLHLVQQDDNTDHSNMSTYNLAVLIGLFNVLNPQNYVAYHRRAKRGCASYDKSDFSFDDGEVSDEFLLEGDDDYEMSLDCQIMAAKEMMAKGYSDDVIKGTYPLGWAALNKK